MVDIGSYGKEADSGILAKSNLGKLINDTNFYPPPNTLPNSGTVVPFIIVGDEASRLSKHLMKPFATNVALLDVTKAVFNYRLSRARRVSENAYALLNPMFRIFYLTIAVRPEVTDDLIMTACCLHNMLRDSFLKDNNLFLQEANMHDIPTKNMIPIRATDGFSNAEGFDVRDKFTHYFNSQEGSLSWQEKRKANFDGVIGAVDGFHVVCKIPIDQHDSYQDRCFDHSSTLQGICAPKRLFTNVSVGWPGSIHDARIFKESAIGRNIESEEYFKYFYEEKYHLLGDSAYALKSWLMTPYR
ncbi:hypothetical protein CBL_02942 [Carabus blaptoides fortunei]